MNSLQAVALLLIAFSPVACAAKTEPGPIQKVDERLSDFAAEGGGAAIIIEVNGEVLLRRGYGLADRARGASFTTETVAQLGSLTKQFTATAILTLASKGDIDLSARVDRYLPDAPAPLNAVTLHQLLTHTGGLPEYCGEDFVPMSLGKLLHDCLSAPLLFEPGSDYAYSNPGYSVLAAIVEAVSGEPLDTYLKREILLPNGLDHTGYAFSDTTGVTFAHGYLKGEDQGVVSEKIEALGDAWWNVRGNGGMQASTEDMDRWRRVLSGDGKLDTAVVRQLRMPHTEWKDGFAEGYGWFFRDEGTGRVRQMSHSGSDGVFFSYYWDRPEDGVFVYFVGNSGEGSTRAALRDVLGILEAAFVEDK